MNNPKEFERESWVDFVKVTAIFLVVLLHAAAPWVYRYGLISDFDWQIGNIIDSVTRVSVPLFFMTTGYLLLSKPISLKKYFDKRVKRIVIPWLVWSIIYLVYKSMLSGTPITIAKGLFELANGDIYFHFWFLYTLMGLYLFVPIISWFLEIDTQKRSLYFLIVWFIATSIVPFLNTLARVTANSELEIAIDLSMFSGFTGYLIAGYLIGKFNPSRPQWMALVAVFILGTVTTILGASITTFQRGRLVEYFYDYAAPNVIAASFAAFAVLKKIGIYLNQSKRLALIFAKLGYASLGIYLIHPIIFNTLNDGMLGPGLTSPFQKSAIAIIATAIITFLLSYIAVEIILHIPVIRRIV